MIIQFGVREHIKMAETYQWTEEELAKQRKRELEELREEMHQMETFKRKLDEYADEMRRMDNWMVERLSEYVMNSLTR